MTSETKITKEMINDLRAKEGDAFRKYQEAKSRREDAEKQFHKQESGVENGALVSIERKGEKKIYFFDHFDSSGWMYGRARCKNGDPSKSVTCLYRDATVEQKP